MSKKFQLQIPEPCHEDWNKMSPVGKGRFCDACQKAVVDFTGMSDMQLIVFFKKPSIGSVCGRFYNDQLERDFEIPRKRIPWLKYFFQIAVPAFLFSSKVRSQGEAIEAQGKPVICLSQKKSANEKNCDEILVRADSIGINGRVLETDGKPIPFASIIIKGTTQGVQANEKGEFNIRPAQNREQITLIASSVGYSPVEKQINRTKDNSTEIILSTNATLNGEVVVACGPNIRLGGARSILVTRITYLEKVKDFFIADSIKIFPNPAKAGSEIRIEWRKAGSGEYTIDLYNLQGQLIKSSLAKIERETNSFTFQIPVITPGSYVLHLINKKTGKKHAGKIIIQ